MTIQTARPTPSAKPTTPVASKPTAPVAPKAAAPVAPQAATPKPVAPPPASEVPPEPEPAPENGKREFVNHCELTVHIGAQPTMKVTADGRPWATARAFVSMGKDKNSGEYKPSLWLTVKAFTTKDGDDTLPNALNAFEKGAIVTVAGRLAYEEYTTSEGEVRSSLILIAYEIA